MTNKINHFQRFGLPVSFHLDEEDLETKYLSLQKKFHPDNFQGDNMEAEMNSIFINQAYEALLNPLKRASYILSLKGINIDSDECHIKPNLSTLDFVISVQEEIDENKHDKERITHIKRRLKIVIGRELPQVIDFLDEEKYEEAAQKLIKIKYLNKTAQDLKNATIKN
jgi:molecular chaperone HscB